MTPIFRAQQRAISIAENNPVPHGGSTKQIEATQTYRLFLVRFTSLQEGAEQVRGLIDSKCQCPGKSFNAILDFNKFKKNRDTRRIEFLYHYKPGKTLEKTKPGSIRIYLPPTEEFPVS